MAVKQGLDFILNSLSTDQEVMDHQTLQMIFRLSGTLRFSLNKVLSLQKQMSYLIQCIEHFRILILNSFKARDLTPIEIRLWRLQARTQCLMDKAHKEKDSMRMLNPLLLSKRKRCKFLKDLWKRKVCRDLEEMLMKGQEQDHRDQGLQVNSWVNISQKRKLQLKKMQNLESLKFPSHQLLGVKHLQLEKQLLMKMMWSRSLLQWLTSYQLPPHNQPQKFCKMNIKNS